MVKVRRGIDAVDERRQVIREQNLLHEAGEENGRACLDVTPSHEQWALDLRQEVGGADNRAGHQPGEESDEQREVEQAAARDEGAAVDVEGVAHRLEGEEGDTHGENDIEVRHVEAQGSQSHVGRPGEEVVVLEETQQAEVEDRAGRHVAALRSRRLRVVDAQREEEVRDNARPHQAQESPTTASSGGRCRWTSRPGTGCTPSRAGGERPAWPRSCTTGCATRSASPRAGTRSRPRQSSTRSR